MTKNMDEINRARAALMELEKVRQYKEAYLKRYSPNKTNLTNILNTYPQVKRDAMGPAPTVDLTNEAIDELPDLENPLKDASQSTKTTRIPAPKPAKEAGFFPSSARGRDKPTPKGKGQGKSASKYGVGRGRASSSFEPGDNPEAKASEEEEEEDLNLTKMEKIRKVLAKKAKGAVPEGEVETLNQMIRNHENKAPKQEAVGEKTIRELWPEGEKSEIDRNANMVANVRGNRAKVDFVLIQDVRVPMLNGKVRGISLPSEEVFKTIVNKAITDLLRTNISWCNVCCNNGVNKLGIGVVQINYGYPEGPKLSGE